MLTFNAIAEQRLRDARAQQEKKDNAKRKQDKLDEQFPPKKKAKVPKDPEPDVGAGRAVEKS